MPTTASPTGYGFNHMENIKSHSAQLFNERMAIIFFTLDFVSVDLYQNYGRTDLIKKCFSLLQRVYINMRTLIRNDPVMRTTLNLETSKPGLYTTDLMFTSIDNKIQYCNTNGYTYKKCSFIVHDIMDYELLIHDVLQYYEYFIRPKFHQKPDIEGASEKYKLLADKMTVEQLKQIVGKQNKIDFDNLQLADDETFDEIEDQSNSFDVGDDIIADDSVSPSQAL